VEDEDLPPQESLKQCLERLGFRRTIEKVAPNPALTLLLNDFPIPPPVSLTGRTSLRLGRYRALLDAEPWDAAYAALPRVSRTVETLSDDTPPAVAHWVTKMLDLQFNHRMAIWERTHWLPLRYVKEQAAALVTASTPKSGREQASALVTTSPTRADLDSEEQSLEPYVLESTWTRFYNARKRRHDKLLRELRLLVKEAQSVPLSANLPAGLWTDPWLGFFYADHNSLYNWNPSSTDLISDLAALDKREPVRLHWAFRPSGHPFFTHSWTKLYPNGFYLPFPELQRAFLRDRPASPLARLAATPALITVNSKAEQLVLQELEEGDAQ
jgi:hypothetical protein